MISESDLNKLKFPIGKFISPTVITKTHLETWIKDLEDFPNSIISLTKNLSQEELNLEYRPNGWTIKQVIHHCADSHMNSIIRFKLALTEDTPTIRPYFEDRWALLRDYNDEIDTAVQILKGIHKKLSIILKNLTDSELRRKFTHPEHGQIFTIAETIGMYAWHSNHHLAHIKQALLYRGKF